METPPETIYSVKAETALLGSVIIDPAAMVELNIEPGDFYIVRNRMIWNALQEMHNAGQQVDYLTLTNNLEAKGQLAEIGGPAYLMGLVTSSPTSLHAQAYAAILRDKSRRRALVNLVTEMGTAAFDEKSDLEASMPGFIEKLANVSRAEHGAVHISEYMSLLYDEVDLRSKDPQEVWGIPTGLGIFDGITGGLQKQELMILSGAPGMGKSMLAMQSGAAMAKNSPGAIYSLEMSGLAVARRLVSGKASIGTKALKTGRIKAEDWPILVDTIEAFSQLPIYLSDCSDWTTARLRADLARLKAQFGIEWFIVDYLYLLSDGDGMDETAKTTMISRALKRICRQLDLAGIAVHSMNKAGIGASNQGQDQQKKSNDPPGNEQLRGSGQVIYDADVITFLTGWKPGQLSEAIPQQDQQNIRVLWITKGREIEDPKRYDVLVKKPTFPSFAEWEPPRSLP